MEEEGELLMIIIFTIKIEAAVGRCSTKEMFLKISQNSQAMFGVFFRPEGLELYYKETPSQVFSCEFWEILRKNFQTTACFKIQLFKVDIH